MPESISVQCNTMNRVQKQQLLRDMGIDVWRLRPRASAAEGVQERTDAGIEPFKVVCLASEHIMLLLDVADSAAYTGADAGAFAVANARHIRRFGHDLLASVAGDWQIKLREAVFAWPQPGLATAQGEAVKALSAFVDKQLADGIPKEIVLISEKVVDRLPDVSLPEATILVPPIDQLMCDWQLKRKLWLVLQTSKI